MHFSRSHRHRSGTGDMKPRAPSRTLSELVAALSDGQAHDRPARHARPRGVDHGRGRRRGRQHLILYVMAGLVLVIVTVGSLARHIDSLAQYIRSPAPFSKSLEQRPEAEKTAGNAEAEREAKE